MYLTSKDRLAEGRFGAMFKKLPAFAPSDDLLTGLAQTMVEPDTSDAFLAKTAAEGGRLFAGFTFIGQFIDHDITLDNTPLEQQQADPDAKVNFRTPRYDLDSVYGGGPTNQPNFYDPEDPDRAKLLLKPNVNGVLDVPRDVTTAARSSATPATTRTSSSSSFIRPSLSSTTRSSIMPRRKVSAGNGCSRPPAG